MKRFWIGALICVNLALIAAVAFHARPERAYAARGRGAEYLMITMRKTNDQDAVIVIDSSNRLIRGWYPSVRGGRDVQLVPLGPRDLSRDFPVNARR